MAMLRAAAAALLPMWSARAYDMLHVVDVAAVVCPEPEERVEQPATNLALGKTVTCNDMDPFMLCYFAESVTDGNKGCTAALGGSIVQGRAMDCTMGTYVQIDLGATETINEVVLYQFACDGSTGFCGHKVETSTDGTSFSERVSTGVTYSRIAASSEGTSLRFEAVEARYVRVHSGMGRNEDLWDVTSVPFLEVEVYNRVPFFPQYSIGIDYETSMDVGAPHIVSFLRQDLTPVTIEFDLKDADGRTVLPRRNITLQDLSKGMAVASCKCTGVSIDSSQASVYGAGYGGKCDTWDKVKCDEWFPNALGEHCCQAWCYADPSCPDAYKSSVVPGAYFSYHACDGINQDLNLDTCPFTQEKLAKKDPCECKHVGNLFNDAMKSKFSLDYGSSCAAWDEAICDKFYTLDEIDTWCCSNWCYVDETCPHAKGTMNDGMEGILFWADSSCTQDTQKVLQCPFRKIAESSQENLDACDCLYDMMPAELLPAGASVNYGAACGAHDAEKCAEWFPNAVHDMWCCTSWCWVSPSCPTAQPSTLWPGHYYSGMSCNEDTDAIMNCPFSDACKCSGLNTGVDTAALGVGSDYGTSCASWEAGDCTGILDPVKYPAFWTVNGRNDWCCQSWCYVSESCPLAEPSYVGGSLPWSYLACEQPDPKQVYQASANKCTSPASCECSGAMVHGTRQTPTVTYGLSCGAWDADFCDQVDHFKNISCCLSWCWVDENCPTALPSPSFPGNFYSDEPCGVDATALATCKYSDACACTGTNPGVQTDLFGADYGKSCAPHDAEKCKEWWGPTSPTNLWSDDNDWCCLSWCYVKEDCPLAAGYGEGELPFSYESCANVNPKTYVDGTGCAATRRLGEAPPAEPEAAPTASLRAAAVAAEGDLESCEDFFLLDGRSPVELPDTWADARAAAKTICRDEGFDEEACEASVERTFRGLPADLSPLFAASGLCDRLRAAAGAAAEVLGDLSAVRAKNAEHQEHVDEAVDLARDVHALLHRAGRTEGPAAHASELELTVQDKLQAALEPSAGALVLGAAVPIRRMKGSSGGGSSSGGSWGSSGRSSRSGSYYVPNVRRRAPSRPVAAQTPRRRAVHADDKKDMASGLRRRRTDANSGSHRRRSTDISGQTQSTPSGVGYGYTSSGSLYNNYGGMAPSRTNYGYTGAGAMRANDNKRIAMYAGAGAVGGAMVGYGMYHAYYSSNYYTGSSYSMYRRRRSTKPEYCIVDDPGANRGVILECFQCYKQYTSCRSTGSCFEGSGCNYQLPADVARDDLQATGFMPDKWTPRLQLFIYNINGTGFSKAQVCPPKTASAAILAEEFGSATMAFKPRLFVTLTKQDELGLGLTNGVATCEMNTQYNCKNGATSGSGTSVCYGEDEECKVESATGEAMCWCKPGFCLEGSDATTRACHAATGLSVSAAACPSLLLLVACLAAAALQR